MASINDQFEQGRIPIKVLSYKDAIKKLAQCDELIIDYLPSDDGNTIPSYHIYIADHNDPENLIDITNLIIKEILPNAKINANQFQILLEGAKDPTSLKDILNFIYKRFTYPDNINGFNYITDFAKIFDPTTVSVLLRNTDGTILLPVTTTDNVYDRSGKTIEDRLNSITRVGFDIKYVRATENNQTEFIFDYPFENYSDFVELRIGGTYIDKNTYSIENITENGVVTKGKITFLYDISIEQYRRLDILFIYNAKAASSSNYSYIYGHTIADGSIPYSKLEKISDSYALNDPTSIASSAAVYKLFMAVCKELHNNDMALLWSIDDSTSDSINYTTSSNITTGSIVTLTVLHEKSSTSSIYINGNTYQLKNIDGSNITNPIPAGTTIRLLLNISNGNDIVYLLSDNIYATRKVQSVFTCTSANEGIRKISYDFNSNNDPSSDIIVYRNGVRLFKDIDYVLNNDNSITLEVRLNGPSSSSPLSEGERIVFETNRI